MRQEEESYMDKVQEANQEGELDNMEVPVETGQASEPSDVEVDAGLDEDPMEIEKEVESDDVVFVPHEDFEARINQTEYTFQKGVRHRISRSQANDYVKDERGYLVE